MTLLLSTRVLLATLLAAVSLPSAENGAPIDVLRDVGIDQRLDNQVPLDLTFRDESGAAVHLGDYFDGQPVVLVLAYYRCPMLCTQVLNGLVDSLRGMDFEIGKQFRVVTVSFDPREGPDIAARKKENYATVYGRAGAESGWHFLTGDQDAIARLTKAVGFRYAFDAALNQFAHASGIMVLTPQGAFRITFWESTFPHAMFAWRWLKPPTVESVRPSIACCCCATTTTPRPANITARR